MRDISDRFKNEQNNDNRNYLKYADITLTDGTVINLTNADFWSNGMKFEDSVSDDNTFNIGSANINTLNLSINNFDGKYTDYDFTDATVICYVGIELEPEDTSALLDTTGDKILDTTGNEIIVHKNALIEKIRICTMTVIDTPYQNTTIIELECEDNMRKFDRDYSASKLKYPATRKQIIQDACKVCGVTLDTLNFYQDSYQIPARPDDEALTFRQVIAWTCQIGCQYARCDKYGRLTIKWYDTEITDANRATIKSTNGFTPNLDDVVITGVQVTEYLESTSQDEEASSYLYGEEGYVLKISENKLIPQGTGEVVTNIIGEKCVGMSFRPFETECLTDIVLEAGDAVLITDRKGNKYKSYLTNVVLQPGTFEQISCNAESAARNSSKTYSLVTQAAVDARKSVWRERTTREQALQEFKDRLDNSTGVYTTVQTQQDGSQIFYLHDKPTLAESRAVWKMTAEAWGVSTDGGQTWNGGMTVDDGNQISRLGYTGYVVLNKNTGNPMVSLNTAGLRLYTDYTDADNYNALMLGKYGLYAQKVQNKVLELWMEGDTSKKWEGYIVRYLNNKVRINTNSLFTDGCELGANFSTDGSATIGKSLSVGGNATVNGTLMFYDLENQAKTSGKVKRQPVASVSADDSQVAYLFSGTGSKHGDAATYRRLGIRAKWGGSGFSTDYLYTASQVSDIRLKENVKNSETDALETVNRMKVRQFDWKERMGGWHQNIGFVADELEEIDPNLALGGGYDENGEMDIKQINSPYLLNYAIKAIQELSAKVDEQEKHIKELERRLQ